MQAVSNDLPPVGLVSNERRMPTVPLPGGTVTPNGLKKG